MVVKKKEIKAIVFDIGSVVTRPRKIKTSDILSKQYGISSEDFLKAILKRWGENMTGKISVQDYYRSITSRLKIKNTLEFEKRWKYLIEEDVKLNRKVLSLVKKLKKNYKTIAFTNVSRDVEKIGMRKGVYDNFDLKLISCKEGMKKPNKNFYELLIKKSKYNPHELVFIDDKKPNLLPAQKLGMQIIHFKNAKQLKKDLKNRGVKL